MRRVGASARRLGGVALALGTMAGAAGAQMLPDTGAAGARTAQWRFETYRKARIPVLPFGSGGECEVRVGRLCYWDSNEDSPPPEEPKAIGRERAALVAILAASDSASPNEWVASQLVRYLVESRRTSEAVAAARGCDRAAGSSAWWCAALRGYALHAAGDDAAAAAAYDSALATMPDSTRCRWTDVSTWLDGGAADRFGRLPCGPERERAARRVWWLARPLIAARDGDDGEAEFLARRTLAALYASSKTPPYATSWGPDVEEVGMRYGWPVAWTREPPRPMEIESSNIVGHEPRPAHSFVPAKRAMDDPTHATDDDWALESRLAHSRYAPVYADSFSVLGHQLARFRRGDSSVFVAAYDVGDDERWTHGGPLRAGFALAAGPDSLLALAVRDDAPAHGALLLRAPARGALAGVELYSAEGRRAARARYGVAPLAHDAALSDILLVRADGYADAAIADLDDVAPRALGSATVAEGGTVGLFWETYLTRRAAAPAADDSVSEYSASDDGASVDTTALAVSLTIVPVDISFAKRLAIALRLAQRPTPMTLKWDDSGRAAGPAGHVLVLHTEGIPAGRYRLELAVSGAGLREPAVATREIEVRER